MSKFSKQFTYTMHKKNKQKIGLCIFLKIGHLIQKLETSVAWKFQLLRNLRYHNFIQSYVYFKKYFEYGKISSQHLLKMNRNI